MLSKSINNGGRAGSRIQSGSRATNTDNNEATKWSLGGPDLPSCSQRQDGCGEDIYFLRKQCLNWKDTLCYSIQKKKHMTMDSAYRGLPHDH